MKKRLLALALCLVLATSLLPITAAATTYLLTSVTITASGVEQGSDGVYRVIVTSAIGTYDGGEIDITSYLTLFEGNHVGTPIDSNDDLIKKPLEEGTTYRVSFNFVPSDSNGNFVYLKNSSIPAKLEIPGYAIESYNCSQGSGSIQCIIYITKLHEHTWQLTQTDSTLTVECGNNGCPIRKMSVELKANSVTLPDSPFNARLEGWEQLVSEFPNAKRKFEYKYRGPEDSEYHPVDPIAANAKAGEYQVGVYLWDITRGPIDPSEGTYLYVQYTAADPKVTAQTGDSRPIELMMASVLVFSALAAAAFILDSKRKYSR